ncbi:LRR receptor-like serine/threonine-protein kinase GSO2 [Balamuthia mandrillaris]
MEPQGFVYPSAIIEDEDEKVERLLKQQRFLQAVSLRSQELTHFPRALLSCTSLQSLDLDCNHKLQCMPDALMTLPRLLFLSMANNGITYVPDDVLSSLSSLQYLNLAGNRIRSLPASLGKLTRLSELYLQDNGLEELPRSIGRLSRLRVLQLQNNKLQRLPSTMRSLTSLALLQLLDNRRLHRLPLSLYELKQEYVSIKVALGSVENPSSSPFSSSAETKAEDKEEAEVWQIPTLFSLCATFLANADTTTERPDAKDKGREEEDEHNAKLESENLPREVKERAKEIVERCYHCQMWLHKDATFYRITKHLFSYATKTVASTFSHYDPSGRMVWFESPCCYLCSKRM